MTIQESQSQVREFVKTHGIDAPIEQRCLDLVSEVGELAKEILLATDYGKRAYQKSTTITNEVGDIAFALICVANSLEIDIEHALSDSLSKYTNRIAQYLQPSSETPI